MKNILASISKKLELNTLNLFLANYTKYNMFLLSYKLGLIIIKIHFDKFRITKVHIYIKYSVNFGVLILYFIGVLLKHFSLPPLALPV